MTDLKFEILGFIYHTSTHECDKLDIDKRFFDVYNSMDIAINDLLELKPPLLYKVLGKNAYGLTSHGNLAYEVEEENREQKAHERAQREKEYVFNKRNCIIAWITAAVMAAIAVVELFIISS